MSAPSGSRPTCEAGAAPWVLPKVWPPAIRATVSSSSIAMRPKVSRISGAAATGSGLPSGPSPPPAVFLAPFRPVLVADVAAEPGGLGAPVDVLIRLPDVLAAAAEAE